MKKITVVGSASIDLVIHTDIIPQQGETLFGNQFATHFGGKGANQAMAAKYAGCEVAMIGAVGTDTFGDDILTNFQSAGIDTEAIERIEEVPTGIANILIQDNDNRIIIVPGANDCVTKELVQRHQDVLLTSQVVIIQNEIPRETITEVINFCYEHQITTVYNPAPARKITAEMQEKVNYITPNETEYAAMFPGIPLEQGLAMYANQLIVTIGSEGVIYHDGHRIVKVPAYKVQPVDTTGAGDTFNGYFAAGLTMELPLENCIRLGNLASAYSIQKPGAQGGIPLLSQLEGGKEYEKIRTIK